ncbi:biotin/lipoate A/B ligase family protein, partial [Chlamydia psittaci 84-8471/1]
FDGR